MNALQILARLLRLLVARHALRERELAVRPGADAEVVAELPVVEVVPAAATRLREGRDLVVLEARAGERLLARLLHVGAGVVLGQPRRPRKEHGVGLDRQLVGR